MRDQLGASGAEKLCALGAIKGFRAAPQLHRWAPRTRHRTEDKGDSR